MKRKTFSCWLIRYLFLLCSFTSHFYCLLSSQCLTIFVSIVSPFPEVLLSLRFFAFLFPHSVRFSLFTHPLHLYKYSRCWKFFFFSVSTRSKKRLKGNVHFGHFFPLFNEMMDEHASSIFTESFRSTKKRRISSLKFNGITNLLENSEKNRLESIW